MNKNNAKMIGDKDVAIYEESKCYTILLLEKYKSLDHFASSDGWV